MRLYTVDEANASLPRVRDLLARLRLAVDGLRFAAEQLEDLRRHHWQQLADPESAEHAEAVRLEGVALDHRDEMERAVKAFEGLGVEIKDPIVGLVDFYGRVDGEVAFLCWREGEESVGHWHPIDGGYAARKPLPRDATKRRQR